MPACAMEISTWPHLCEVGQGNEINNQSPKICYCGPEEEFILLYLYRAVGAHGALQ